MFDLDSMVNFVVREHDRICGKPCHYESSLLESAIATTFQSAFGQYIYQTKVQKAACLFYEIIENHPFDDGNKRTALTITMMYLKSNNCNVAATEEDFANLAIRVAENILSLQDVELWFIDHLSDLSK
jgi:death-on-curing protein